MAIRSGLVEVSTLATACKVGKWHEGSIIRVVLICALPELKKRYKKGKKIHTALD
jgi:hypothetical protein